MRTPLTGSCVWTGDELAAAPDWRFALTPPMLAEIDSAVAGLKRRDIAWDRMERTDFPVPETERLLARVSAMLEDGRGLAKLTGLPVERYDDEDLRRTWYGFGLHLGTPVSQSQAGLRMKVIRDEGATVGHVYGQLQNQRGID